MTEIEQVVKALNGIAEAIHAEAEATVLLARATAGEFSEDPDDAARAGGSLSDVL